MKFPRTAPLLFFAIFAAPALSSCAGGNDSLLEQARFALDRCDPADAATLDECVSAIEKTDAVQAGDPSNLEAAVLESSAHLGLAGFDFLQLAARLADLENRDEDDFSEFRNMVADVEAENGREIDLDDLDAAKAVLTAVLTAPATPETEPAFFQLAMIQATDAFIRPSKIAGEGAASAADIDDAVAAAVEEDFLFSDDNFVASGTTEDDILRPVRENFCRCLLNGGFTAACLRDLMRCELSDTAAPEQDYDGDAAATLDDCAVLVSPPGLDACGGTDTSS